MVTAPASVNIVEQHNRFSMSGALFNLSHGFQNNPLTREVVATIFANNKGLIDELNIPPSSRDALRAYVPPPSLSVVYRDPKQPCSSVPLTTAEQKANLIAITVVEQSQAPIQQLALEMTYTASRNLRGTEHFNAVFRNWYEANYLSYPSLRFKAIRGGQPDVDYRPSPAKQTAREIGVVRQHADVALLPVMPPPAPAASRRVGVCKP